MTGAFEKLKLQFMRVKFNKLRLNLLVAKLTCVLDDQQQGLLMEIM